MSRSAAPQEGVQSVHRCLLVDYMFKVTNCVLEDEDVI